MRVSIRTLLLAVIPCIALTVFGGKCVWKWLSAQHAVELIRDRGGYVISSSNNREGKAARIEGSEVTIQIDALKSLDGVDELTICNAELSEDDVKKVRAMPSIQYLALQHCSFVGDIPANPNIIVLEIIDDGGQYRTAITSCPKLESLSLFNCEIGEQEVCAIANLNRLDSLQLVGCSLRDDLNGKLPRALNLIKVIDLRSKYKPLFQALENCDRILHVQFVMPKAIESHLPTREALNVLSKKHHVTTIYTAALD